MTSAPAPANPQGHLPRILANWQRLYEGTLVEYFQALWFVATNLRLPYHNFRHCTHVLFLCYQGADFHKDELTPRRIRNLLIAAIFHDFNHTGVAGDDAKNIDCAIDALRRLVLPEDRDHLADIELLVRGTQYPPVLPDSALPLEGLILRDADLMQAFSVAWIQQVIFGLAAEGGQSPFQMLTGQKGFLGAYQPKTAWGEYMVPDAARALKIEEAEQLIDILMMPAQTPAIRAAQLELAV